ncbi:hypothetical protein F4780DRAFT_289227 [Xylariomycetidae sp. FL0641]|nr:hypothetical protein F4780DRAFT_289227 [Xylariomycetidae sp. FL0641]
MRLKADTVIYSITRAVVIVSVLGPKHDVTASSSPKMGSCCTLRHTNSVTCCYVSVTTPLPALNCLVFMSTRTTRTPNSTPLRPFFHSVSQTKDCKMTIYYSGPILGRRAGEACQSRAARVPRLTIRLYPKSSSPPVFCTITAKLSTPTMPSSRKSHQGHGHSSYSSNENYQYSKYPDHSSSSYGTSSSSTSEWRWKCCDCGTVSNSYMFDTSCTECLRARCKTCEIWAAK